MSGEQTHEKRTGGERCLDRLVRRHAASSFLDFPAPVTCECGGSLEVKDHRFYDALPTASREMRYEVRCDKCFYTDPNGYATHAEVLGAYVPNIAMSHERSELAP